MATSHPAVCGFCRRNFETRTALAEHIQEAHGPGDQTGQGYRPTVGLVLDTGQSSMALVQMLSGEGEIPASKPDEVTTPPTMSAEHGRAWEIDLPKIREYFRTAEGRDNPNDNGIAAWVVEAPWAHPVWHSYWLALIHLREIPGGEPVWRKEPTRTHQLFVMALNQDHPREALLKGEDRPHFLMPLNFSGQFEAADDEAAIARVRGTVQLIIEGKLSPDTDFLRMWVQLYGADLVKPGVL